METTMKKSSVYTRTGDAGMTSLVGGSRISKSSDRLEAYGTIDELNSYIGLLAALPATADDVRPILLDIQHTLFDIGGYLACDPESDFQLPTGVTPGRIEAIERMIDLLDSRLPSHNRFILPGGSIESAHCQIARTVCRRAERRIITLSAHAPVAPEVIAYVNRLSDLLFIIARNYNIRQNIAEIFWENTK